MIDIQKFIFIGLLIYLSIASSVWSIRNPTANDSQLIFNIVSVITFSKEDKFQAKD